MKRAVVAAFLLGLSGMLAGCTDFSDDGNMLLVRDVDLAAPEVGAGRFVLEVTASIANEGGRSGAVNVTVKAYDSATGLLVGSASTAAGRFARDETRAVTVGIELARANAYRLRIDLEEGDELVHRADLEARNLDTLAPNVHDTGLRIAASDFRLLGTQGNRTTVQASVYLTNEGAVDSQPLSLQVRAREDKTSLVVDEAWTSVGAIRRDATRPVNVTLDLPAGYNYGVEVTLWDGDLIVERGAGRVQLGPVSTSAPTSGAVLTTPTLSDLRFDQGDSDRASKASKTPGVGVGVVAVALAGLALIVRRRLA